MNPPTKHIRGTTLRMGVVTVLIAVLSLFPAFPAFPAESIRFEGRSVADVLRVYQLNGYEFLYSSGSVRSHQRFEHEPGSGTDVERLKLALADIGLELIQDAHRSFRIIRHVARLDAQSNLYRGRVIDADSGAPIVGALVEVGNSVLVTNDKGEFELPGRFADNIRLTHEKYLPKNVAPLRRATPLVPFEEEEVEIEVEVELVPLMPLEEMVVVSSRYAVRNTRTGSQLIDLELLESLPSLGEDPIRITNHLPGMATIGVSAKPHIRGGLQDEVLVLFNNLELLEPFHLRDFQSIFSSFNPSVIETIDVYTGGFPARYGDRMSGVMDIMPGVGVEEGLGELSVSLLNTGLFLRNAVADGRGDWVASARRGNLDIVADRINSSVGEPAYSDTYAQFRYEIDAHTEFDVGLIAYNDDIELSDFDEDGEVAVSKYRNLYGWVQLHRAWSPRLAGTSLVYFGSIGHDRDGFLIDEDLDNGRADVRDEREFSILSANQSFNYRVNEAWLVEIGARVNFIDGRYDYNGLIQRGVLADILGTQINELRQFSLRPSGRAAGVYTSIRGEILDGFSIEGGLRWDYQDYGLGSKDHQISPRFGARWRINKHSEFRFSAGRFFQPEGIHELQVGDGEIRYQPAQYSDHVILSWYQELPRGFSLRTEGFYKWVHDPKRRYENLLNPVVLLPELASDRVEVAPERARVRGYELTLKYETEANLMAWLSYSHSSAQDKLQGRWESRVWDQGQTVSAGFSFERQPWQIGATVIWHDGWRTTDLPAEVMLDQVVPYRRNSARIRDFFSLDVQVSYTWAWPRQTVTAFLEVTNALSRRNVGGIEYDVEELGDESGYELIPAEEELLPLVPSIGVRWTF